MYSGDLGLNVRRAPYFEAWDLARVVWSMRAGSLHEKELETKYTMAYSDLLTVDVA